MMNIAQGVEIADMDSLHRSIEPLDALIEYESQFLGSSRNIFLLGYSQGGMMALWHGLTTHRQLGGIVAINTCVPVVNFSRFQRPFTSQRIAHFHGSQDTIVPAMFAQRGHENAQRAGCPDYTLQIAPGGHDLSMGVAERANAWLIENIHQ